MYFRWCLMTEHVHVGLMQLCERAKGLGLFIRPTLFMLYWASVVSICLHVDKIGCYYTTCMTLDMKYRCMCNRS